jgi:hypothetical protein
MEESFNERDCYMACMSCVDERYIGGPIHSCYRASNEARFEWKQLIDQGKSIPLLYHPLNLYGSAGRARHMDGNSDFREHLGQPRMRRWMKFRITKHGDAFCDVVNIEQCSICESIIRPHTDNKWRLGDLLNAVQRGVNGEGQNGAVESVMIQPLQA